LKSHLRNDTQWYVQGRDFVEGETRNRACTKMNELCVTEHRSFEDHSKQQQYASTSTYPFFVGLIYRRKEVEGDFSLFQWQFRDEGHSRQ